MYYGSRGGNENGGNNIFGAGHSNTSACKQRKQRAVAGLHFLGLRGLNERLFTRLPDCRLNGVFAGFTRENGYPALPYPFGNAAAGTVRSYGENFAPDAGENVMYVRLGEHGRITAEAYRNR